MSEALTRITGSQKTVLLVLAALGNAVAQITGAAMGVEVDPTEGLSLVWNSLVGLAFGVQALLDLRWGSQSDGSGDFAEIEEELEDEEDVPPVTNVANRPAPGPG